MLQDLKYAWRQLRHAPGFAIVAILTLAVAVGANTAVLSLADGVLFRPLPYRDADRVMVLEIFNRSANTYSTMIRHQYIEAINRQATGVSEVAIFDRGTSALVPGPEGPEAIPMIATAANYFDVLGVRPIRGRLFAPQDTVGRTALLTYRSWRSRFGGDESIVGKTVTLGSSSFDVVGVLPADFLFPTIPSFSGRPEIVTLKAPLASGATGGTVYPIVRLEPGVSQARAQAEIDAIIAPMVAADARVSNHTVALRDVRSAIYPFGQTIMKWLLTAALLVLLMGCANLANMLIARGWRRERETAMRTALGASRLRVVRPIVLEALLLGLAGSGTALAITYFSFDVLRRQVPAAAIGNAPIGVDVRIALIGLLTGLAGGLLFAVLPAWRSSKLDVLTLLHARGRGARAGRRFGRPMIIAQVAFAVVLVFGAAVATRAFVSVLRTPLGFNAENVLTVFVVPPTGTKDLPAFYRGALDALAGRPDVVAAGASGSTPLGGAAPWSGVKKPGSETATAAVIHALPGFFEAAGIDLVKGRTLTWDDRGSGGVVLSESAARTLFSGSDPIGQTLDGDAGETWRVVGIVRDVRASMDRDSTPPVYVIPTGRTTVLDVLVRMRTRQESARAEIRRAVAPFVSNQPVATAWWSDSIDALTAFKNPRFQTMVLASFATIAIGLTALGIFGVVAFVVAARTREIGIRTAIGASPRSLVALVVRQTIWPVVFGLVLGLVATRGAAELAKAQLFKVETDDPLTLVVAVAAVLVAALVAAYVPARRAARIDPLLVLKAE